MVKELDVVTEVDKILKFHRVSKRVVVFKSVRKCYGSYRFFSLVRVSGAYDLSMSKNKIKCQLSLTIRNNENKSKTAELRI